MDGVENRLLDPDLLEENLNHRTRGIGGARSIRRDLASGELGVIDAHEHRGAHDPRHGVALDRRRDDDLARAGVEVSLGLVEAGEEAGRLDDDVDLKLMPREVGGLLLLADADLMTIDDEHLILHGHRMRIAPVGAVVTKQVS